MTIKQELATLLIFLALFAGGLTLMNRLLLPQGFSKIAVLVLTSIAVALLTIFVRYQLFYRLGFLR